MIRRDDRAGPLWLDCSLQAVEGQLIDVAAARHWDVLVVGAGIVGLSAAISLVQSGRSVCVVEAHGAAEGTTGRATAKVTSAHGLATAAIADRHGMDVAVDYQRANDAGYRWLADVVARMPEDVGWTESVHVIHGDGDTQAAISTCATIASHAGGSPTGTEAPRWARSTAMTWGSTALVQPVSLGRALARHLMSLGGVIVQNATVRHVEESADGARLSMGSGAQLTARTVLIASHVPIYDPSLIVPRMTFQWHCAAAFALQGGPAMPTTLGVDDHGFSTRPAALPDGRPGAVVVGPAMSLEDVVSGHAIADLHRWLRDNSFDADVQYEWTAHDGRSPGVVPLLQRTDRHPHVLTATGMNSWGFTNAAAMAIELPALLDSPKDTDDSQPYWRLGGATSPIGLVHVAAHTALTMAKDHVASIARVDPSQIPPGQGVVVGGPARPRAVARTRDGCLHEVSARCTHAGCLVAWNEIDQVWDCPCHGSRFTPDGTVLQGPASRPLADRTSS